LLPLATSVKNRQPALRSAANFSQLISKSEPPNNRAVLSLSYGDAKDTDRGNLIALDDCGILSLLGKVSS
jgi:hypothetical protein